jgi:hypothetical protein
MSGAPLEAADEAIEQWKIRALMKKLTNAKG